jgi:F-type H+-transporting ATPase subunit a
MASEHFDLVTHLAGHVKDGREFHFPWGHAQIPDVLYNIGITKFVLLEMIAAVGVLAIFIPMAHKLRGGKPLKGRFWNMIEAVLIYVKDNVIIAGVGTKKDAAPYLSYLLSLFFFVLFCNLLGMIPWMGSPTGAVTVTATLALLTLGIVIATGSIKHGLVGFWTGLTPPLEGKVGPVNIATVMGPILFVLEIFSFFVKHLSLCIRLMANMYGGHMMLAVFLGFIPMAATSGIVLLWISVSGVSFGASVAISFLELFVACLQAYIFTFLTSIYIGMAIHQH